MEACDKEEFDGLGYLELDYQGDAMVYGKVDDGLARSASLRVFPASVPMGFRERGDYAAFRVVVEQGTVVMALIRDQGAVDAWKRPVLSARVLTMTSALWERWGRDLVLLRELLSADMDPDDRRAAIEAGLLDDGWFLNAEHAREYIGDARQLAAMLSLLYYSRNLILYDKGGRLEALLLQATGLLPLGILQELKICTGCEDAAALGREQAVIIHGAPPAMKLGAHLKQLLWPVIGRKSPCAVTMRTLSDVRVDGSADLADAAEVVLRELSNGLDWEPISYRDKVERLIGLLDDLSRLRYSAIERVGAECLAGEGRQPVLTFRQRLMQQVEGLG